LEINFLTESRSAFSSSVPEGIETYWQRGQASSDGHTKSESPVFLPVERDDICLIRRPSCCLAPPSSPLKKGDASISFRIGLLGRHVPSQKLIPAKHVVAEIVHQFRDGREKGGHYFFKSFFFSF